MRIGCGKAECMGTEDPAPAGLLSRSLTVLLLAYTLVLQLFVGAYFQQTLVVQALNGDFTICSTHLSYGPNAIPADPSEVPADNGGKAQCLALCQLACGIAPGLTSFLRVLPAHQPHSHAIRWQQAAVALAIPLVLHAPKARGPPIVS